MFGELLYIAVPLILFIINPALILAARRITTTTVVLAFIVPLTILLLFLPDISCQSVNILLKRGSSCDLGLGYLVVLIPTVQIAMGLGIASLIHTIFLAWKSLKEDNRNWIIEIHWRRAWTIFTIIAIVMFFIYRLAIAYSFQQWISLFTS